MTYLTHETKKSLPITDTYQVEGKELIVKELHRYRCESCVIVDFEIESIQGVFRIPRYQDFEIDIILKILVFNWDFIHLLSQKSYESLEASTNVEYEVKAGGFVHTKLLQNTLQSANQFHKPRLAAKKTYRNIPSVSSQYPNTKESGVGIFTKYLIKSNSFDRGKEWVSEFFQFYPYEESFII